jgi:LEM3 (ligand-effect modulator 3) family / CDC50 family
MPSPVYIYYRLTNFYQNNRRYVKSFDLNQLGGTTGALASLTNCAPLDSAKGENITVGNVTVQVDDDAVYYPCGLIANSLFSGMSS